MSYLQEIRDNKNNPQQLEALFQAARGRRETSQFSADLNACHSDEPDNQLLQAWYYAYKAPSKSPGDGKDQRQLEAGNPTRYSQRSDPVALSAQD